MSSVLYIHLIQYYFHMTCYKLLLSVHFVSFVHTYSLASMDESKLVTNRNSNDTISKMLTKLSIVRGYTFINS